MEVASILGTVLVPIIRGAFVNYSKQAVTKEFNSLLKSLNPGDPQINQPLYKALKFSFVAALQKIAWDCHKEIVPFPKKWRGQPVYPVKHKETLIQLDSKIRLFAEELKQIRKVNDYENLITSTEEIAALLTSEGNLAEDNVNKVKDKLIEAAFTQYGQEPECYATKVKEVLFEQVGNYFQDQIIYNPEVYKLINTRFNAKNYIQSSQKQQLAPSQPQTENITIEKKAQGTVTIKISGEQVTPEFLAAIVKELEEL